jgi:hypothetical protein
MLKEGIIRTTLRRNSEEVSSPFIRCESLSIPLLDGIRRIRKDYVKLLQVTILDETGRSQGVIIDNRIIFYSMKEQIHSCD